MQEDLINLIKSLFYNIIGVEATPFYEGWTKTLETLSS